MDEKFAIIAGEIHRLIKIKDISKIDPVKHPWYIYDSKDLYWVPVPDRKAKYFEGKWEWIPIIIGKCGLCKRKHPY